MKNRDIKNLFLKEDEKIDIPMSQKLLQTPIQEKLAPIKEKKTINKRLIFVPLLSFALVIVLAISFIFSSGINSSTSALTAYIVDINPSISITTNNSNEIVNICSLNEDADEILSQDCFDNIVGKSLDKAIENIIIVAKEKGYFNEYQENIQIWTLNDNPVQMKKNLDNLGDLIRKNLNEQNLEEINFEKHEMPLDEFRQRMGFDGDYKKLDDMKADIQRHDKYKGNPPPPHDNPPPDDNPHSNDNLPPDDNPPPQNE